MFKDNIDWCNTSYMYMKILRWVEINNYVNSVGVSFLCSSILTISTTAVDELNVLLSRGLVELFRSRFGMSEIETKKQRNKETKMPETSTY